MPQPTARQSAIRRVNSTLMRMLPTDNASERHTAADLLAAMVTKGEFDPHTHRIRKMPPTRDERRADAQKSWEAVRAEASAAKADRHRQHREEMEPVRERPGQYVAT